VPFEKHSARRTSAQCFEAECSRAGKQVENRSALHAVGEQVEQSLANSVFHRARARVTTIRQHSTTEFTADDAYLVGFRRCCRPAARARFTFGHARSLRTA